MKINSISFGKILSAVGIAAVLFVGACKEKDKDFETPCVAPAAPSAGNNSPVGLNSQLEFTAESVSGATYSWKGPNGFSSSEQNPILTFNRAAQAGEYSVTVTVDGCTSAPGYTYVSSCIAAPAISIANNSRTDGTYVIGDTVSINGAFNANATYRWDRPNGNDTLVQSFIINGLKATDAGTYKFNMTLQSSGGGCTTPDSAFMLEIKPTIPITSATGVGIIGVPATGTYIDTVHGTLNMTASGTAGATFKWSGPNGFSATTAAVSIPNLTKAAEGTYYVHSILNGVSGDSIGRKVIIKYAYTVCGTTDSVLNTKTGTYVKIVQIGNRCWTKANINKTVSSDVWTWAEFNAATPVDSQSVCPTNWHPASDADFTGLATLVANDGNALKDTTEGVGAGKGTNTSGFSAKLTINTGITANVTAATSVASTIVKVFSTAGLQPGDVVYISQGNGVLAPGTTIVSITNTTNLVISQPPTVALGAGNRLTVRNPNAFFWTNTKLGASYAWYRQLNELDNTIFKGTEDVSSTKAYSVRCIRD
jgi:uncharacterized protein (TIGR02145 family)